MVESTVTAAEMTRLSVHPKYRHEGIARALVAQVEAMAVRLGYKTLDAVTSNPGGKAALRHLGFTPEAKPLFVGSGVGVVQHRKPLPQLSLSPDSLLQVQEHEKETAGVGEM